MAKREQILKQKKKISKPNVQLYKSTETVSKVRGNMQQHAPLGARRCRAPISILELIGFFNACASHLRTL
jgi:hypothetical protein